jgi:hypothetical protein
LPDNVPEFDGKFFGARSAWTAAIKKVARSICDGTMRAMASATFTYFFMTDTRATDTSAPREWTHPKVSASQAVTVVWTR